MKSLEHIIREIREGKAEKGDKKTLEGAIRKVMKGEKESSFADRTTKPITDDVGGLIGSGTGGEPKLHKEAIGIIGTDDYQGNQFKSVRTATPHIKPPAGAGSHSQAPENVSRQRTLAKEKSSMTLHGKVSEQALPKGEIDPSIFLDPFAGKILGGATPKAGKPARKAEPEKAPETPKRGPEIQPGKGKPSPLQPGPGPKPANDPTPTKPTIPDSRPPTRVPAKEVPTPANEPVVPTKPAAPKPAAPETPTPAPAPRELPKTIPGVVPGGLPLPVPFKQPEPEKAPKNKPAVQPKPQELPVINIPAAKPETATKTEPKVAAVPVATTPAAQSETTPKTAAEPATTTGEADKKKLPGLGGASIPHEIDYTASHLVRPKVGVGHAKAHKKHAMRESEERKTIENMPRKGDRKSIEYVGRSNSDPKTAKEKTSRLAIIKNVIDEARKQVAKKTSYEDGKTKMFDYGDDVLIINPNQKRVDLDVEGNKIPKDYDNK